MEMDQATGVRKIGWFCSFVPEELILAAGLTPVRLRGLSDQTTQAEAYVFANLCPYLKNLLESGLTGRFPDLAGLAFVNSCDGMRRLADLWRLYVDGGRFFYQFDVPKNRTQAALDYYTARLAGLKSALEGHFRVSIGDDDLGRAIDLMNEHRRLAGRIFENQKSDPPRLSGRDLWTTLIEESSRPKAEGSIRLRRAVESAPAAAPGPEDRPRLMIMGNVVHRPVLFDIIERAGGDVALLDNCHGRQHYEEPVENAGDPLAALARRYLLDKPSCHRLPGLRGRLERLAGLVKDFRVQGVIYLRLKYCDYGLFESPGVEKLLRSTGTPALILENDYVWNDVERTRVRVEAFLEMIKNEG
ncbi:MAG: 2-hydroxyacyl-CoA dehydratase family protein [Thermodesulfobacteriota bacterium]